MTVMFDRILPSILLFWPRIPRGTTTFVERGHETLTFSLSTRFLEKTYLIEERNLTVNNDYFVSVARSIDD